MRKSLPSLGETATVFGFFTFTVIHKGTGISPDDDNFLRHFQVIKPMTWDLSKAGDYSVISGPYDQFNLLTCPGAEAQQCRAHIERFSPGMCRLIARTFGVPVEQLKLAAAKLLCAKPGSHRQIFHADTALGFNEKARFFSVLFAITDGHKSTLLPCFRTEDLPTPIDIAKTDDVLESPVQQKMLQMLYPVFWNPANYKSVEQKAGGGVVLDNRTFHAGPANDTSTERRRLFLMFKLEDVAAVRAAAAAAAGKDPEADEQQLYQWVYAEWAFGTDSAEFAAALVSNRQEGVLERIEASWLPTYIGILKKYKRMGDYLNGITVDDSLMALIKSTPAAE